MKGRFSLTVRCLAAITAVQSLPAATAPANDLIQMIFHMRRPPAAVDPSVEQLAEEVDWLEKHVDAYGSVVAKQPDVWGQARLTRHREEFDQQMYQQLNKFDVYLQGAVSQSDQSFLANALTLQAAASSPAPKPATKSGFLNARAGTHLNLQMAASTPVASSGSSTAPKPSQPDAASLISNPDQFFSQQMRPFPFSNFALSTSPTSNKIGIEPTIALDQRATFLDHLHEIRRRNEGDDTADAPGYGLYLVRVPVSVMPGKRTYHGYAAEITITAQPHINPSLLPVTFRNLVVNDVVDQLALPITRIADTIATGSAKNNSLRVRTLQLEAEFIRGEMAQLEATKRRNEQAISEHNERIAAHNEAARITEEGPSNHSAREIDDSRSILFLDSFYNTEPHYYNNLNASLYAVVAQIESDVRFLNATRVSLQERLASTQAEIESLIADVEDMSTAVRGPATRLREARNAIPPSEIDDVFGAAELYYVAKMFHDAYTGPNVRWNEIPTNKHVMYLDVAGFLQEEIQAAYELLARPESLPLWYDAGFNLHQLAYAIRAGRFYEVCRMRDNFYRAIHHTPGRQLLQADVADDNSGDDCQEEVVKALAWAILVESSLLNEHLIHDMKVVAQTKPAPCVPPDGMAFYWPDPDQATRAVFNEYIMARWPIHVFALDPYAVQQNIANDFQRRRELQIAIALGFAQGQISANNMMKYARRVETEIQTVQLNQTIVGFSHGDDTFGWRFYPRLQPPPIKGNLQTFGETLFGPSSRRDNIDQKLEPGMRECVALVIMPSFVPYMTFETRSNWFRLNAHSGWLPTRHKREMSMADTMKLSRSVRSMHDMSAQICDAQAYRVGDVHLLMNRVHQLDRLLPMQGMLVQVPIENTLGGYQMFNNGFTDLAPELHGWYGAPGIALYKAQPPNACSGCAGCAVAAKPAAGGLPALSLPTMPLQANNQAGGCGDRSGTQPGTPTPADNATKLADTTVKLATDVVNLTGASLKTITDAASQQPKPANQAPLPPDCDCSGTTVFLVGNHFSVVDTKVIAGGMCIPRDAVWLLSRQVLQATIPWNAKTVTIDGNLWVDVHVATPYGVTGYLHIPAYYADSNGGSQSANNVATSVSPLEVMLDSGQQLIIEDDGDNFSVSPTNAPNITMHCVDDDVCQPAENGYAAYGFVYNGTDFIGATNSQGMHITADWLAADHRKGTLKITPAEFFAAMRQSTALQPRQFRQKVSDLESASLTMHLYLKGANRPSVQVIGPLPIVFQKKAAAGGAARGGSHAPAERGGAAPPNANDASANIFPDPYAADSNGPTPAPRKPRPSSLERLPGFPRTSHHPANQGGWPGTVPGRSRYAGNLSAEAQNLFERRVSQSVHRY